MLISREFKFDAAHNLIGYKGKCETLHGHTWKIRVTISGEVNKDSGMAFDFIELKKIIEKEIILKLDHCYLNKVIKQPTTENIALWIWKRLERKIPLYEVKVWESEDCFATLNKEDLRYR